MPSLDQHSDHPTASRPEDPRFLVGQDHRGFWVAVEIHGLGGGFFRTRTDAVHYATGETRRRMDAVVITGERIELRP